ncbi:hypothetical protein Tco_0993006 [Tanacetum coccineum]|uniref:Integrase, catalytic region, zinc finger, CCHC-type, peptidase aspartic, catalytic n=1 Tax=Tanacetum coccineum TaxID=301880 RepID=A0ABQ5F5X4_9ASTR
MTAFWVINKQFQMFIDSQFTWDHDPKMTEKFFTEYTGINVKHFRETLLLHMGNVKKSITERAQHEREYDIRMNKRQMLTLKSKVVSSKALDADLVVMESNGTESRKHDTSSSSGNYITHEVDADIRPVNDQVSFAEVDSNTTPDSTNMCHRGGKIDQDAKQHLNIESPFLKAEFFKTNEMIEKETYNELSHRFLLLEKHCISLELEIQQKDASFQSNKPGKNQDAPEFHEFFEINDLKAQLQAKTTLICNLKNQIKSVKEASNEAKLKNDIDVIDTINIELEHKVAKLLKENKTLKKHYKDLYDSIKVTRTMNIEQKNSLIAKNDESKAQIQEKVFANAALKNELRKLKGTSVNTKFTKSSILGKPPLQPYKNQSVVRQPTAFRSERPKSSKPRFASQVDVKQVWLKPVTLQARPNERESASAKPHHMITSSSSRISSKCGSFETPKEHVSPNDIVQNHNLEEAKKKTHEKTRNLPVSKSCVSIKAILVADHSKNPRSFSDSKHFVCSMCHKCVFNANHDACVTKYLNHVNSRAKVQPHKTTVRITPVDHKIIAKKHERQITTRYSFSKSSAVHKKTTNPRSFLRWKPTGKCFKIVGLRWVPTGRIFSSSTSKVNSEPHKVPMQISVTYMNTTNLLIQHFMPRSLKKERCTLQCALSSKEEKSSFAVQDLVVLTGTLSSMTIDQDEPSTSTSQATQEAQSHVTPTSVEEDDHEPSSEESSSRNVIPTNVHLVNQPQEHIGKWTKDQPHDNIFGNPSRPVSTRLQLQTQAMFCYYDALLSLIEPKSYKDALTESCWIEAMKSSMSSNDHIADEYVPATAPTRSDEQILPLGGRLRYIDYRLIQITK